MAETIREWKAAGCGIRVQEPLAAHTSFKIGGAASCFVTVTTPEQAALVYTACQRESLPLLVIGNGSNLLVSDAGFRGVVLQCDPAAFPLTVDDTAITVPAGMPLGHLCMEAQKRGLAGLEFAYGIPGTVGGGIYMNAGAYGGEIADVLERVTLLRQDGTWEEQPATALALSYRHSILMEQPALVWSATFRLTRDDPAAIRERMEDYLSRRKEKQPLDYPSAGSFFKRPEGHFAGALIESCGLKGATVGGAMVSEKHAGFLINRGNATFADVWELSEQIIRTVREQCGVTLEREVQIVK